MIGVESLNFVWDSDMVDDNCVELDDSALDGDVVDGGITVVVVVAVVVVVVVQVVVEVDTVVLVVVVVVGGLVPVQCECTVVYKSFARLLQSAIV